MAANSEVENTHIRAVLFIAIMVIGTWLLVGYALIHLHDHTKKPEPRIEIGMPVQGKLYGVHKGKSGYIVICLSENCERHFNISAKPKKASYGWPVHYKCTWVDEEALSHMIRMGEDTHVFDPHYGVIDLMTVCEELFHAHG